MYYYIVLYNILYIIYYYVLIIYAHVTCLIVLIFVCFTKKLFFTSLTVHFSDYCFTCFFTFLHHSFCIDKLLLVFSMSVN